MLTKRKPNAEITAGIQAYHSGREFLKEDDGYLQYGNLAASLDKLVDIPEAEWATILPIPESAKILEELTRRSASESEVVTKLEFGADLPRQIAEFVRQMKDETLQEGFDGVGRAGRDFRHAADR